MSVNLDELNQNMLRVIENADNQGAFLQDFLGGSSADVTFYNIDAEGNKITRTVPNVAKFTASVAAAVKGEMNRTVYLDQNAPNGGDGSLSSPYNEIQDIIASSPVGAKVTVYVIGTYVLRSSKSLWNGIVNIVIKAYDSTSNIEFIIDNQSICVSIYNDVYLDMQIDFTVTNSYDSIKRRIFNVYDGGSLYIRIKHDGSIPSVGLGDNTEICFLRNNASVNFIAVNVLDGTSINTGLVSVRQGTVYAEPSTSKIMFNSVESATVADMNTEIINRTSGVVKTNNVPINVSSNVQF